MPKSRLRKKVVEQRTHEQEIAVHAPQGPLESPAWLAPTMVTAFLIGLLWIVTRFPIPGIGAWNMIVGFSFIGVGFSLATKWR
jgi:hypothetical protein